MIGLHEFYYTNRVLIKPDGSVHRNSEQSIISNLLEDHVNNGGEPTNVVNDEVSLQTCHMVDAMGEVKQLTR